MFFEDDSSEESWHPDEAARSGLATPNKPECTYSSTWGTFLFFNYKPDKKLRSVSFFMKKKHISSTDFCCIAASDEKD